MMIGAKAVPFGQSIQSVLETGTQPAGQVIAAVDENMGLSAAGVAVRGNVSGTALRRGET
jgi:hypothetical protein